jgi:hypothetical protein
MTSLPVRELVSIAESSSVLNSTPFSADLRVDALLLALGSKAPRRRLYLSPRVGLSFA